MPSSSLLGPAAALAASVTWVVGSSVYAQLAKRFSPSIVNFNRALVALPLFVLVSLAQYDEVRASIDALGPSGLADRAGWLALSIVASYALGDVLFMWAMVSVGFPTAQSIGSLYPLIASCAAAVVLHEPLSLRKLAGVGLAIAGSVIVVLAGRTEARVKPPAHLAWLESYGVGILLALGAAFFWALNSFAGGRGGANMNPAFANVLRMPVALVLCPLVARALRPPGAADRRLDVFFERADYVRYLPFFAVEAFGGSYLYIYGLSHSSVATGATLSSLAPVVSVPVAVALGWERFSWIKTGAVLLVVAGVALLVGGG